MIMHEHKFCGLRVDYTFTITITLVQMLKNKLVCVFKRELPLSLGIILEKVAHAFFY